ncbi:lipopolysaccharide biosynthesis protein [Microbacterium kunmingense]|uniref:lipopolysaccharide biosynthesis protein n=1 Tax=Microbacterium kunmingense TaxID=2915939 RepID=UPI003D74D3AD
MMLKLVARVKHSLSSSVGSQAAALSVSAAVSQVLVAVLYILAARSESPAEYGHVVAAIALGTSAIGFVDFGSTSFYIREMASQRMAPGELSRRTATKWTIAIPLASVTAIVMSMTNPIYLISVAIFSAGLINLGLMVPIRAARRGDIAAGLMVGERLIAAAVFFALLLTGVPALQALVPSLISGTVGLALLAWFITPKSERIHVGSAGLVNPWRGAMFYGIYGLAASAQQLDLPLVAASVGTEAAGVYGAVNRWTQPMGLIATAFSSAAAPFVANAASLRDARRLAFRASWILALAILAPVAMILAAPALVLTLLGPSYSQSVALLQLLAAGSILAVLNQPLATILQARKHDRFVAIVYLASVVLQLSVVMLAGGHIGATAAGIAYCVLQAVIFVGFGSGLWIYSRREARSGPDEARPAS